MTKLELADSIFKVVGETMLRWHLSGIDFGIVVDGKGRVFEAGATRAYALEQARAAGVELLELTNADGILQLGTAFARELLQEAEREFAGATAAGAGKA